MMEVLIEALIKSYLLSTKAGIIIYVAIYILVLVVVIKVILAILKLKSINNQLIAQTELINEQQKLIDTMDTHIYELTVKKDEELQLLREINESLMQKDKSNT